MDFRDELQLPNVLPWKPRVSGIIGFFLGPTAAGLVAYINLRRLNEYRLANWTFVLTVITSVLFGSLVLVLPDDQANIIGKISGSLIAPLLFPAIQLGAFSAWQKKHEILKTNHGLKAMGWGVIGFVWYVLIIFSIGQLCFGYSIFTGFGKNIDFSGSELYYNSSVTEAEVQRLGEYLIEDGYFGDEPVSAQLTKKEGVYQFRVVVEDGVENNPRNIGVFLEYANDISEKVFAGEPVECHLCDSWLRTLRIVAMSTTAEMIEQYTAAITRDANDEDAFTCRSKLWSELSEHQKAIKDLDNVIRINPSNAWAWAYRGEAKRLISDYQGAIADFDESLRIIPQDWWVLGSRAQAKSSSKDYAGAVEDFNQAISLEPNRAWLHSHLGEAKRLSGDYDGAISDLSKAIAIKSDCDWAYAVRGEAKRLISDYQGAIADFDQAIRLDPEFTWAVGSRGQAKAVMEDHEAAVADFTLALKLDPELAWIYAERGVSFHELGENAKALRDLKKAKSIGAAVDEALLEKLENEIKDG